MNRNITKLIAGATLLASFAAFAQSEPVQNIDPYRHGNLAAAQNLVVGAYDKLSQAQRANDSELGGHAARAKELLREANEQIKAAALAANRR